LTLIIFSKNIHVTKTLSLTQDSLGTPREEKLLAGDIMILFSRRLSLGGG